MSKSEGSGSPEKAALKALDAAVSRALEEIVDLRARLQAAETRREEVETLLATIRDQDGARVPGDRRKNNRASTETDGVKVNEAQQRALGLLD